jgi:hypothetical protein
MAGDARDQRRHVVVASKGPAKDATDDASVEYAPRPHRMNPAVVVTALGVVFGDLGTSPLYTFKAIAQATGGTLDRSAALGSLSLIFWALIITISVKYCWFVMRADNHGEGGILALMAVTRLRWRGRKWPLIACGLFGAALLYGDGVITPAISVLSALEGIGVATNGLADYAMPIAAVVLVGLFAVQSLGTERVGSAFGPIMLIWFVTIAVLGIVGIVQHPAVLAAANPVFAAEFLTERGFIGFAMLGAVFLAITGGEALYADMGQFGRSPIRLAWFGLVLPALVLNYAGQTALLLDGGDAAANPFYHLAPTWALYRQSGHHLRSVFIDTPGHAARLVSRRRNPTDIARRIRPNLRSGRELDDDDFDGGACGRLPQLRPPCRRIRHSGLHHHDADHRSALRCHAPHMALAAMAGAFGFRRLHARGCDILFREPPENFGRRLDSAASRGDRVHRHDNVARRYRHYASCTESRLRIGARFLARDRKRPPHARPAHCGLSDAVVAPRTPAHSAARPADRRYSADIRRLDGKIRRPTARAARRPRRMAAARAIILARHASLRIF